MKRLALLALLAVAIPSGSATGSPGLGSRFLPVLPNGAGGSLMLYDLTALKTELRLPPGLRAANGRSFLAVRVAGARTALTRYLLPSGRVAGRSFVRGRYALAALSADGARAVLADARPAPGQTRFAVVDAARGTIERRVTLRGSYGVEALSPEGRRLFLVRYDLGGYNLRLYDLATRRLSPTPLAEGASAFNKMVGVPWTSVATRDGRWLLTLYVKRTGGGFVHALDLRAGVGHCIDVAPEATQAASLRASSLALSPDERTLYVASPVLGRLLLLDVERPAVVATVRFPVADPLRAGPDLDRAAAASPSGGTVAFAVQGQVWRYDAAARVVRSPIRVGGRVAGLGFTPDGRRIVLVRADGRSSLVDTATGQSVR